MSKGDKNAALVKDYERPSKDCPFKVKNIEECDAKRTTVIKRTEEDGPFKGKLDTLEINCWCKFPMYHFFKRFSSLLLKLERFS